LNNPLKNGGIVLGVRIDDSFDLAIKIIFVHILLYLHDFLKDGKDVSFSIIDVVEIFISLF